MEFRDTEKLLNDILAEINAQGADLQFSKESRTYGYIFAGINSYWVPKIDFAKDKDIVSIALLQKEIRKRLTEIIHGIESCGTNPNITQSQINAELPDIKVFDAIQHHLGEKYLSQPDPSHWARMTNDKWYENSKKIK